MFVSLLVEILIEKSTNLHHGVVISDDFMELIENATKIEGFDDSWDLIDPHSGEVN